MERSVKNENNTDNNQVVVFKPVKPVDAELQSEVNSLGKELQEEKERALKSLDEIIFKSEATARAYEAKLALANEREAEALKQAEKLEKELSATRKALENAQKNVAKLFACLKKKAKEELLQLKGLQPKDLIDNAKMMKELAKRLRT